MIYQLFAGNLADNIRVDLPASKSLSNRALILKALCSHECHLSHLSDCDDTRVMLDAFSQPLAGSGQPVEINIGAAGTSMRFLTAYYATRPGADILLTGSERMKQRPIQILVDALRSLGADIEYAENEGFPPLRIRGRQLEGGDLLIDGSTSSQYISALLMVAPTLQKGLHLFLTGHVTSRPYIEMTLHMMEEMGVKSSFRDSYIEVEPQAYQAHAYAVESDWSASSYWYEMMALCRLASEAGDQPLNHITLLGLHAESLQGDSAIASYFAELGIQTTFTDEGAVLTPTDTPLPERVEWDLSNQPDLAQTLIVTCCGLRLPFRITGLHTLRIKETDRIAALQTELRKCGMLVDVKGDDEMSWEGQMTDKEDPILIETYQDHRMAMAFAPLAISMFRHFGEELSGPADCDAIYIHHPEVVSKSYPTFWQDLRLAQMDIVEFDKEREQFLSDREYNIQRVARTHKHAKRILDSTLIILALLLILLFLYFIL